MTEEILKVAHLNKFYGERQVLFDINFELKKGEVLALLGPSGSGKSTTIRTLNGLEDFQSGQITFAGQNVIPDEKHWQKLRQKIGMVFQSYDLFPNMTVLENIILAPTKVQHREQKEAEAEAKKLLAMVGLSDYEQAYPRQLSGGQKQRVALARAMMIDPEIIGYDEPTSALDPELRLEVEKLILQNRELGMTQIVVTHDLQFAENIADVLLKVEPK